MPKYPYLPDEVRRSSRINSLDNNYIPLVSGSDSEKGRKKALDVTFPQGKLVLPKSGLLKGIQSVPERTEFTGGITQQDLVYLGQNPAISFLLEPPTTLTTPTGVGETPSHFFLVVAPTSSFDFLIKLGKGERVFNFGDGQGYNYRDQIISLIEENLEKYEKNILPGDLPEIIEKKETLFELKKYILTLLKKTPQDVSFVFFNESLPDLDNLTTLPLQMFGNLETDVEFNAFLGRHFERLRSPTISAFAPAAARSDFPQISADELAKYSVYHPKFRGGKSKKKTIKRKKNKQKRSKKTKKAKKSRISKIKTRTHRRH